MTQRSSPESSWFGFKPVDPNQKTGLVRNVFDRVAQRYDLMNDLMSLGIHRLWKKSFIDQIHPRPGQVILDLAGGTGDIAFGLLNHIQCQSNLPSSSTCIIVCDINAQMLSVGRDRAIDHGYLTGLEWVVGNAESIPLPNRSVDIVTIAFGLRNVTHINAALKEAWRVLKPGGQFYCLEFSRVVLPVLDRLYDAYSFNILPQIGAWVAENKDAYTYLVESIRKFPDQKALAERLKQAGFSQVKWRNLSGGIAAVHSGWRL